MDRLIYRARIATTLDNTYDLRVVANGHGLIRAYLADTACALEYAGIEASRMPSSVAEGGGTNVKVAEAVARAMGPTHVYRVLYEWIEPEPKGGTC